MSRISAAGRGTVQVDGPATEESLVLEVRAVSKAFGETQALREVDLQCRPGEVHTILGENGSGKSTLVKALAGVVRPDAGEVVVRGQAVREYSPRVAAAVGLVAVFQEVLVAPSRSVIDNVLLGHDGLLRRRIARRDRPAVAREALAAVGAELPDLATPVEHLPLSVQQQVVIARALVHRPQVLILDESTAALDAEQRDALFAALRGLSSEGVSVVFISHRMDEVMTISDRVTVLRDGCRVATVARADLEEQALLGLMGAKPGDGRPSDA